MRKLTKAAVCCALVAAMLMSFAYPVFATSGKWIPLKPEGQGYRFRIDRPDGQGSGDTGQWHVHVNDGRKDTGCGGVNGKESHGKTLANSVSSKHRKQIEQHPDFISAKKEQSKLDKQRAKEKKEAEKAAANNKTKKTTKDELDEFWRVRGSEIEAEIMRRNLDMLKKGDVLIAAGLVAAATGTWFFPADDYLAWANFFRAMGMAH